MEENIKVLYSPFHFMKIIPLDFYVEYFISGELMRTWGLQMHRTAFRETSSFKLPYFNEVGIKIFKFNIYCAIFWWKKAHGHGKYPLKLWK